MLVKVATGPVADATAPNTAERRLAEIMDLDRRTTISYMMNKMQPGLVGSDDPLGGPASTGALTLVKAGISTYSMARSPR